MIISNEELKEYVFGALIKDTSDGMLRLSRFTKRQMELNTRRKLGAKNYSCVSMSIEFMTDADEISFKWKRVPDSDILHLSFNVLTGGVITDGFFKNHNNDECGECCFKLIGTGKRHVSIRLPNYSGVEINDFYISGNVEKVVKNKKILVLGDSITQGAGSEYTALTYPNIIADRFGLDILNQGIGGDVFCADNLGEDIGFNPDYVTVAYGTNDWSGGRDVEKESGKYFQKLKALYPDSLIFDILPIWGFGADDVNAKNKVGLTLDDVRELIKTTAEKYGIIVLNGKDYVPHLKECFYGDLHPSALGYTWYAESMIKDIIQYLR